MTERISANQRFDAKWMPEPDLPSSLMARCPTS